MRLPGGPEPALSRLRSYARNPPGLLRERTSSCSTRRRKTFPTLVRFRPCDRRGNRDPEVRARAPRRSLSPEERARTAIFANDWGVASAVDYFGPKYGLPRAISNHNSYWFWGPRDCDGGTVIVLGSNGEGDRKFFSSVIAAGQVDNPWSREDEHFTIWLCRGLKWDFRAVWPRIKGWG